MDAPKAYRARAIEELMDISEALHDIRNVLIPESVYVMHVDSEVFKALNGGVADHLWDCVRVVTNMIKKIEDGVK